MINSYCYFIYYHIKIDENLVFLSSRDGKDFTGNIFRIAEELSKDEYKNFKIYVYAKKNVWPKIRQYQKNYNLKKMKLIPTENRAVAVMERAKFIVSDSGVPWKYVKRKGQIVLNTWHGTPFKVMGRQINAEKHTIGTIQHFFFSSDFLLYPNEYMKNIMLKAYMVENIISSRVIMGGYPRNSIFFDKERMKELRKILGYEEKSIFAYMPTHRGNSNRNQEQIEDILKHLKEIDEYLKNDQILLVKLHVFNQQKIDFTQFQHISPFPEDYETYDILNITDTLITDYSSVFFDYANTRKKIIFFIYDESKYLCNRGTYFPFSDLPFPKVKTVIELINELNSPKNYADEEFLEKYCTYDELKATEKLCKHVFQGLKEYQEEKIGNEKENVLIYGGSLAKNGITTSLMGLLNYVDFTERNYYVSFKRWEVNSEPKRVDMIPENVDYLPLMCDQQYTLFERIVYDIYSKKRSIGRYPMLLKRLFIRELDRYYWDAKFSHLIQFDGYGKNVTLLFMESSQKKTIFVHNDMVQELECRPNLQHPGVLREAYTKYDNIAIVSLDLLEPTIKVGALKERIMLVNNIHDVESIRKKSKKPISFEKETEYHGYNIEGITGVLNSTGKKFITIGRFSPEKGHKRLLQAFDCFCERYPETKLIIIGGHGILYKDTLEWVKKMKYWYNVVVVKSMKNPMPVLQKCDLFILSSLYEGLGLVLLEADCLGVPTFSANITGPKIFMEKYHGHLVENSEWGMLQGMYDYMDGKVHVLDIDYGKYNCQALKEFYSLFEERSQK